MYSKLSTAVTVQMLQLTVQCIQNGTLIKMYSNLSTAVTVQMLQLTVHSVHRRAQ